MRCPASTRRPVQHGRSGTDACQGILDREPTFARQSVRCPQVCSSHRAATPGFQIPARQCDGANSDISRHEASSGAPCVASASSIPRLRFSCPADTSSCITLMSDSAWPVLPIRAPGMPIAAGQQCLLQALLRDHAVHCCASLCSRAAHLDLPHMAEQTFRDACGAYTAYETILRTV